MCIHKQLKYFSINVPLAFECHGNQEIYQMGNYPPIFYSNIIMCSRLMMLRFKIYEMCLQQSSSSSRSHIPSIWVGFPSSTFHSTLSKIMFSITAHFFMPIESIYYIISSLLHMHSSHFNWQWPHLFFQWSNLQASSHAIISNSIFLLIHYTTLT